MTLDPPHSQPKTRCCLHVKVYIPLTLELLPLWLLGSISSCPSLGKQACSLSPKAPTKQLLRNLHNCVTGAWMWRWGCKDLLATHAFSQRQALALRSLMLLLGRSGKVRIGFGKNTKPPSNQTRIGIQRTTATRQLSLREGIRNIQECLETPMGFVGCADRLHSTQPTQQL